MFYEKKLGIIGGGQLGKMLIQAAANYNLFSSILNSDEDCPARFLCNEFTCGDINDYQTVYDFGKNLDVITVEIDQVNVEAISDLQKLGKTIFPQPEILKLIQDKGLQKEFYIENNIPTAEYFLAESIEEIKDKKSPPFVQKIRKFGYDGKGVVVVNDSSDMDKLLDAPSLIEDKVDLKKEISVIVARGVNGDIATYPPTELVFNQEGNLIDYMFSPSKISNELSNEAEKIATKIISALGLVGILAVEMFVTSDDKILVNEISSRPHNTGHHTIEANVTSQFDQHLRAIMGLPLGSTSVVSPAVMVNLLCKRDSKGIPKYTNIEKALNNEKIYIHLYGKSSCSPFRKMGHITILDDKLEKALEKAYKIKSEVLVES